MTRHTALCLVAALSAACTETASGGGDCDIATEHVADCYGAEVSETFAQSCTTESAAAALAEQCAPADDSKSDLFGSTPILSPAVEHFKYGSIGADKMGMPLAVMKALPIVCKDLLPAGTDPRNQPLRAFGMIYEPGKEVPIGFSSRRLPMIGITLVGNTCSGCHTSTVRETASSSRSMFFGAPAIRFDLQRYNDFLFDCISDTSRFNRANLDRAFSELRITGLDRMLSYGSSFLRVFVADLQRKVESVVTDGAWGPGRDDAIGLSAAILLGDEFLPTVPAPVDFPAVWNQQARRGHSLHWDGASGSAQERNILVSVGAGTPQNSVPVASIAAIQGWLEQLPAPKYPYAIDQTKLARGGQLFTQQCASCHAAGGTRTWSVIGINEVRTDRNRLDSVSTAGIAAINRMSGTGWRFDNFVKTDGYATGLLDGIWLRAPYLHNGSVPTLRDLLKPAAQRPVTFFRGNDTYTKADVGFVSTVAREGNDIYSAFDTRRDGNSNAGHEYGTTLTDADRDALLEYLKTL